VLCHSNVHTHTMVDAIDSTYGEKAYLLAASLNITLEPSGEITSHGIIDDDVDKHFYKLLQENASQNQNKFADTSGVGKQLGLAEKERLTTQKSSVRKRPGAPDQMVSRRPDPFKVFLSAAETASAIAKEARTSDAFHTQNRSRFRLERQYRRRDIRDWSTKDLYDAKVMHNSYAHGMRTRHLQETLSLAKAAGNMERRMSRISAEHTPIRKGPIPTADVISENSRHTKQSLKWMSQKMNTSQDWFFSLNESSPFHHSREAETKKNGGRKK